MIKVHHFGPGWGLDDPSPFCAKVIGYLRLTGLAYEAATGVRQLRRAPKAKLPFIDDGGRIVGDSNFILDHLERAHSARLEVQASAADRGAVHALCRMLEEHTYFVVVYIRWLVRENWDTYTRPAFFGRLPWPARRFVPVLLNRKVRQILYGQGIARHSHDEIMELGRRDLQAVAQFLGDKAFVLGDAPSRADATVWAFLDTLAVPPHRSPLKDYLNAEPRLTAYRERMRRRLAADGKAERVSVTT